MSRFHPQAAAVSAVLLFLLLGCSSGGGGGGGLIPGLYGSGDSGAAPGGVAGSDGGGGSVPAAPSCSDGQKNQRESDVDCGGPCAPCAEGRSCVLDGDCASGFCGPGFKCAAASCQNAVQDPGEEGVDCGGACPACLGASCGQDEQCATGYCRGGQCDVPTCADGVRNGKETGVDCGGDCPQCGVGQGCLSDLNCVTAFCRDGFCAEPSCADGLKNQDESDVDCGGVCAGCALGKACGEGGDCTSGLCEAGACAEVAPACDDGRKNGDESDTDCGGSCGGCLVGKTCALPSDCTSGLCEQALCAPLATCNDGEKNGDESDTDCGGPACNGCALTRFCREHSDCLSESCEFGVCAKPTCDDGVKNQGESDTDCGGDSCQPCEDGKACTEPGDCEHGGCERGLCCTVNSCGRCAEQPVEVCNGTDDDCDGATDEDQGKEVAPLCEKQLGVCEGAWAECRGAAGFVCDAEIYARSGRDYELTEESCDGRDNDCDGDTDEGLLSSCGGCEDAPHEVCNGYDDDCDGETDEGVTNACGECGPVPDEVCNGVDDDCDGETDETEDCALCAEPQVQAIATGTVKVAFPHVLAAAGGTIYAVYTTGYHVMLARLADGEVTGTFEVATTWNPNDGAASPQLVSDGESFYMAYRTSQLQDSVKKLNSSGQTVWDKDWFVHTYLDPSTPRLGASKGGVAVMYKDKEDVYATQNIRSWSSSGSGGSAKKADWYMGDTAISVLGNGETLVLYNNGNLYERTSADGYAERTQLREGNHAEQLYLRPGAGNAMHLAFEEYGGYGVGTRVFYALRGSSGSWSEPEVVADGEMPALALDPDGEVYAAVEGTLGVEVWKKQSGGWEKKAELGFTDGGSGLPDLHVDTNGRFHVTLNRSRIGPQDSRGFYYVVLCPQG